MAAMAWIGCWTTPAAAQSAQRLAVAGTVWPRCWVSQAPPDGANPTGADQVRCNSRNANMLVSANQGQFQLCAAHRQAAASSCETIAGEARRVTVTPRS
jgi:hypothetical protein